MTDKSTNVDHVRENIGMVFQHFNLFPHMTVLDNITFAPVEHKLMTKAEAENWVWNSLKSWAAERPMPILKAYPVVKTTCGYRSWFSNELRYHAL